MSLRPKTAATEGDVGALHSRITKIYTIVGDRILSKLDSNDVDEIEEGLALCSPAMLTSMSGWVKQNDVTCLPEDVETVAKNKGLLKDKKRRGAAKLKLLDPAANE